RQKVNDCGKEINELEREHDNGNYVDAISAGVDGYNDIKARVGKSSEGLKLTRDDSMAAVSKALGNRIEAAKEWKKMVAFNTVRIPEAGGIWGAGFLLIGPLTSTPSKLVQPAV
ncbi:TIC110 protein, partial [Nymphaea thermarum]